jgi:DNA-binding response OmpR family regulator
MHVVAPTSIVVVKASSPSLGLVADGLERDGYSVIPCTELARAHAVIQATMPDLVVLDGRGAGATSWRVPAMLKLDAKTSAIPVLLCLADDPDHAALTARAAAMGCSILLEPFEPDDLLARIRDLLGSRSGTVPAGGHSR